MTGRLIHRVSILAVTQCISHRARLQYSDTFTFMTAVSIMIRLCQKTGDGMSQCATMDFDSHCVADNQDGDDDEFLCFTDPATPVVKKLFRKIDATPQIKSLTEAVHQILSADPDIRDVCGPK